jgi:gamma-glutamyltranspeptidase / glutathione hydrolase
MIFASRRSPVYARHGMVASAEPLASMAGVQILMRGGNAADAAIATAAALNVTEPNFTGIGGDAFALYYDAKTRNITALNGSGRAPAALTIDVIKEQNLADGDRIRDWMHPHNITVPGACAAWCDFSAKHGTMPMKQILAPAIKMAEEGFPVAPLTGRSWQAGVERALSKTLNGFELTINGRAPSEGEIFKNPGLAKTFLTVAEGGKDAFYRGDIAKSIVDVIQEAGGAMTRQDLAAHESSWVDPISTTYRDVRVWECPPNGQGLAVLMALNILEGFKLKGTDQLGVERLHLMIEALRVAFADTGWYVADPAFSPAPVEKLLSKKYADTRRKLVDPNRATLDTRHGSPVASSGTVYFCVIDEQGNAASFINSNYQTATFGTGIVPKGWGFALQNRGHNFSLDPNHPNALAPRKRPYHTIIPGMMTRLDGTLYAPFGVMGGFMQPQGHTQVVVGMIDDDLDPQAALDRPRFQISDAKTNGVVRLEEGIPSETLAGLTRLGHPVEPVQGYARGGFGRGQIIRRNPNTGVLCGGSDPRADGCAIGY